MMRIVLELGQRVERIFGLGVVFVLQGWIGEDYYMKLFVVLL